MNLFKILVAISKVDKSLFDVPVEAQKQFLKRQPVPLNDIDRSYNQYKAQMFFVPWWKVLLQNIISLFALPFVVILLLLKSFKDKNGKFVDAIGEFKGLEDTLPEPVKEKYDINNDVWADGCSLICSDISYVLSIILWRHPYFALKTIIKVSQYSYGIRAHKPRAIIVHNEYSFTSSALTAYCNRNHVKHINAMHGEKLFYIRDSWFRYDECYVWDSHYVNLFTQMKAEETQFHIVLPPSMRIDKSKYVNKEARAEYKYYLANNSENDVKTISEKLHQLSRFGHSIKVRLHPRYSNTSIIKKYFAENEIEYPQKISINESISNTDYVIGSYTTVLVQAYFAGKKIMLDDVAYRDQYEQLSSLQYILAKKSNYRLSQI